MDTSGKKVKNKDPSQIQISAEHLVSEAAAINTSGARNGRPSRNDVSMPPPKRQRVDDKPNDEGPGAVADTTAGSAAASAPSDQPAALSVSEKVAANCRTATLFVGNLHPRIGDAHLQKLFSPYGTLNRVSIVKHSSGVNMGQPRGYAFVEFASVESARMAIRRVDGRRLLNKTLAVRPAHEKTGASGGASDSEGRGSTSGTAGAGASTPDPKKARKEKSEVESKIEAVKKAIEEKRSRAAAGKSFDRNR